MIEFKSMGHVAELHGYKITVVDGMARLNGVQFSAAELRELARDQRTAASTS